MFDVKRVAQKGLGPLEKWDRGGEYDALLISVLALILGKIKLAADA